MNGAKIIENIFFTVTCVSVFTCVIRSDYNFAMGLLSYYMMKNIGNKVGTDIMKIARTVSYSFYFLMRSFLKGYAVDHHDHRDGHPMGFGHARSLGR